MKKTLLRQWIFDFHFWAEQFQDYEAIQSVVYRDVDLGHPALAQLGNQGVVTAWNCPANGYLQHRPTRTKLDLCGRASLHMESVDPLSLAHWKRAMCTVVNEPDAIRRDADLSVSPRNHHLILGMEANVAVGVSSQEERLR